MSMFFSARHHTDFGLCRKPEFAMLWLPETMNLLESRMYFEVTHSMEYRCTAIVNNANVVNMHKHSTSTYGLVNLPHNRCHATIEN